METGWLQELGGERVELIYTGRNHSDNSIVMLFPEERALFAVDFVSARRLPFRNLSDSYYPDWIDTLRRVERLDFDILAPGHGAMGTKQDVADHRRYHEDLYNAVVAAARAGQNLEQMKASITLEVYKDWGSATSSLRRSSRNWSARGSHPVAVDAVCEGASVGRVSRRAGQPSSERAGGQGGLPG